MSGRPYPTVTPETAKALSPEELTNLSRAMKFRLGLMLEMFAPDSHEEAAFINMDRVGQAAELHAKLHGQSTEFAKTVRRTRLVNLEVRTEGDLMSLLDVGTEEDREFLLEIFQTLLKFNQDAVVMLEGPLIPKQVL